jgi:hypothetical protein
MAGATSRKRVDIFAMDAFGVIPDLLLFITLNTFSKSF